MTKVLDIYQYIDKIAPFSIQMDFDNSGLLVGDPNAGVDRTLLALDTTMEVVREAGRKKCQLIVSHHPLIFHPLKAVTAEDPIQAVVAQLVRKNIALISAHTNLDLAPGGVSDVLMARLGGKVTGVLEPAGEGTGLGRLGAKVTGVLEPTGEGTGLARLGGKVTGVLEPTGENIGLGRLGELPEAMEPRAFAAHVKKALGTKAVRAVAGERPIKKLAVCGGAGGDLVALARALGADAYVTADAKHHEFLEAKALGITFLDAGHYATENPVMGVLQARLQDAFAGKEVEFILSSAQKEPYFAP